MRRIDIQKASGPAQLTVMAVGDSRSGKTHFAATWPRPIFLMDASEHGWTTMQYMDNNDWYEPDRAPEVFAIEDPADVINALMALKKQANGEPGGIKDWPLKTGKWEAGTVVIDSLTFYADAYFSQLESKAAGKTVDKRQLYGDLHSHLRYLMIEMHKLPYHIIWTALPKEGGEIGQTGGLMVAGQIATKAPARCDLWVYLDKSERRSSKGVTVTHDMHTQSWAGFKAGHRFGNKLDPVMDPFYADIESALGMEPWLDRVNATTKGRKAAKPTRAAAQ